MCFQQSWAQISQEPISSALKNVSHLSLIPYHQLHLPKNKIILYRKKKMGENLTLGKTIWGSKDIPSLEAEW